MSNSAGEAGVAMMMLANDIQELIVARSNPRDRAAIGQAGMGTIVSYDIDHVLSALSWAAASFIVQSGAFPSRHERKRAAKVIERQVMKFYPKVEQVLVEVGRTQEKPN